MSQAPCSSVNLPQRPLTQGSPYADVNTLTPSAPYSLCGWDCVSDDAPPQPVHREGSEHRFDDNRWRSVLGGHIHAESPGERQACWLKLLKEEMVPPRPHQRPRALSTPTLDRPTDAWRLALTPRELVQLCSNRTQGPSQRRSGIPKVTGHGRDKELAGPSLGNDI